MLTEITHESQSGDRHGAAGSLCDCFSRVCFLQMLQFSLTVQTQTGLMADWKLLVVVHVCEWKVSVMCDDCQLRSVLFLYLCKDLISRCVYTPSVRLLASLKDAHAHKLLADLWCSLSRQLTVAHQVFYFLSFLFFFFFLLIIKASSNLSFTPSRSICWGQML